MRVPEVLRHLTVGRPAQLYGLGHFPFCSQMAKLIEMDIDVVVGIRSRALGLLWALTLCFTLAFLGSCADGSAANGDQVSDVAASGTRRFNDSLGMAPTVLILTPSEGTIVGQDDDLVLSGIVGDANEEPSALGLSWTSDLDGIVANPTALDTGFSTITVSGLTPGLHLLTLQAQDSDSMIGQASVSVVINASPSAPAVEIQPIQPTTSDNLEVVILTPSSDPNRASEELETFFRWLLNGQDSGLSGAVVPAGMTVKGQEWTVQVFSHDGLVAGDIASATVLIANSPPLCTQAVLVPSAGTAADSFTCTCVSWEDADSDVSDGDSCVFMADGEALTLADEGACELPAGLLDKGQFLSCAYTPHDGSDSGVATVSSPAIILNAAPSAPKVSLDPPSGGIGTAFSCLIDEPSADPDGEAISYQYAWVVGEYENLMGAIDQVTPLELLASQDGAYAKKGNILKCRVRAFDGSTLSVPGESASVLLGNSPPLGGTVLVDPATAYEATLLSCLANDADDPDGDEVLWFYSWHVNGETVDGQASSSLSGDFFNKGDVVGCIATPSDSISNGLAVTSKNSATIQNTLPTLSGVEVTPSEAPKSGEFSCEWWGWDDLDPVDADNPQVRYQWQQQLEDNSWEEVEDVSTATLSAAFDKSTKVRCVVTPHNDAAYGIPVASEPAQVVNTPPSIGEVHITPDSGGPCDTYVCETSDLVDPDGDDVLVAYRWTLNDLPGGALKATLQGVAVEPSDALRCFARATDGAFDGSNIPIYGIEVGSAPVIVDNAAPSIVSVLLEPLEPTPSSVLTCTPVGAGDLDSCQGMPAMSYHWFVDGVLLEGAEASELFAAVLEAGSSVVCQVTPNDGYEDGESVFSNVVDVGPLEPVVSIEAPTGAGGEVSCVLAEELIYPEPLVYTFYWSFNGATEAEMPQMLVPGTVSDCDILTCRASAAAAGFEVSSNIAERDFTWGDDCSDGDLCTHDACASAGGCEYTPHTDVCDDGDPCTLGETCATGKCEGGTPMSCEDENDCTDNTCLPDGTCDSSSIEGPCGVNDVGICLESECCVPDCENRTCGTDGCGGSCGTCEEEELCNEDLGQCVGPTEGMAFVPASGFWMGCNSTDDKDCGFDEDPFHLVFLDSYEIDLTETTVEQYGICVDTFLCMPPGTGPGCNFLFEDRAQHPINCITFYAAEGYCAWAEKRLCTEAEWEHAARGSDGRRYPWGFDEPDCETAVCPDEVDDGCGTGGTLPVGTREAGQSPYGVHDMAGNVFEWVSDWYQDAYYSVGPSDNPTGPTVGTFKLRRGGAYNSAPVDMRTSARHKSSPVNYGPAEFGIRCCKDFP
jgi:formylglycine-generating enzyme required for sulfatase activity